MALTKKQFYNTCSYLRLKINIIHRRLVVTGTVPQEVIDALKNNPKLEAEIILKEALKNPDLLDSIKERASIRWSDGLSDSLYDAVLCNIEPLNESAERDADGKIILRPCTDWDAELKKFL